jgi:hypothetical protein
MNEKRKFSSNQFAKIKKILWKFFLSSFEKGYPNNPGNPEEFDYRKKLTTKEEKIIYEVKKKMPTLQKILYQAYKAIQDEFPRKFQPDYIKT